MRQDVKQNLDEQILDVSQPYLDVALPENRRDVVVGEELRHQLKMDCCQVVVRVQMVLVQQVLESQEQKPLHLQHRSIQDALPLEQLYQLQHR